MTVHNFIVEQGMNVNILLDFQVDDYTSHNNVNESDEEDEVTTPNDKEMEILRDHIRDELAAARGIV